MVELPAKSIETPAYGSRFIYITGCDGTGKTTQSTLLQEQYRAAGIRSCRVWLRFPFFFSLPLLAIARWRGLSWYETCGDVRHGIWDFKGSRLLQTCLPWTLLLDACLARLIWIDLPIWRGETVICERFVLDMLVDLSLAFGKEDLYRQLPGRLYLRLLPANSRIILLDLDAATIQNRRADLCTDRFLQARLDAYRRLSADLALPTLSSSLPVSTLNMMIRKAVAP
jgi:thymidylate kinase